MTNPQPNLATTIKELTTNPQTLQKTRQHVGQQALCPEIDGDLWYPEEADHANAHHAKTICQRCQAQHHCLALAIATKEQHGIWGGQTTNTRKQTIKELDLT